MASDEMPELVDAIQDHGMHTRRELLIVSVGTLLSINLPTYAQERTGHALGATAVTQVFGDGVRLTAVAVEYHEPIAAGGLSPAAFTVEGRTVTEVFVSTSADPADRADAGRFVILALSPEDEGALLAEWVRPQGGGGEGGPPAGGGPGQAGDIPTYDTVYRDAEARVGQTGVVATLDGEVERGRVPHGIRRDGRRRQPDQLRRLPRRHSHTRGRVHCRSRWAPQHLARRLHD
jgi:hypothetical protein